MAIIRYGVDATKRYHIMVRGEVVDSARSITEARAAARTWCEQCGDPQRFYPQRFYPDVIDTKKARSVKWDI